MAQERRSGHIVPESGVYRATHASAHAGAQLEVRLIKGRHFPACPCCQEISFELAHSDEAFWRDRSVPGTRVGQRGANRATKRWSLDPAQSTAVSDIGASLGDLWRDRGRRSWAVGAKGLMPELRNANERRSPDSGVLLPILFRLRRKHSAHTGCVPCVYLSFDDRCGGRLRVNEDALLILSFDDSIRQSAGFPQIGDGGLVSRDYH